MTSVSARHARLQINVNSIKSTALLNILPFMRRQRFATRKRHAVSIIVGVLLYITRRAGLAAEG